MRHFFRGNGELVALAGADHEMALAAVSDLAGDRIVEEAMLEPIDDEPFQAIERLADLSAGDSLRRGCDRRISHCAGPSAARRIPPSLPRSLLRAHPSRTRPRQRRPKFRPIGACGRT